MCGNNNNNNNRCDHTYMSVGLAKLRRNYDNIRNEELSNLEHATVSFGEHRKAT